MKLSGPFEITKRLAYEFKDKGLLEEALRHSSFVNEQACQQMSDNERLEFLGDAVLNLVVSHMLFNRFPNFEEGELSRMRSNLVNETRVASVARSLDIGTHIQLGKGESLTKGREKDSILSNAFEAIIAAVYIDGGYDAAFALIEKLFSFLLEHDGNIAAEYDYKSRIQELLQTRQKEKPLYRVIEETGPDHNKMFRIELSVNDIRTEGYGKSKKHAEQNAARKALEILAANQNKADGQ
jgi:ribonuclease III